MVFYLKTIISKLMTNENLNMENTKLLIVPCSKIKRNLSNTPALELYDGPFYKIIRKRRPKNMDVLILSAKYGLIEGDMPISTYDQKMTSERAKELGNTINFSLSNYLSDKHYENVHINLGKVYFSALEPSLNLFENSEIQLANGGIGMRLQQLKNWICQHS